MKRVIVSSVAVQSELATYGLLRDKLLEQFPELDDETLAEFGRIGYDLLKTC